jgi:hypothetical protein
VDTIWKFEIPIASEFGVGMPENARILCVQIQDGKPHVWAIVKPDARRVVRRLCLRGTGQALGDVGLYIGTFQVRMGAALVFHLFEAP